MKRSCENHSPSTNVDIGVTTRETTIISFLDLFFFRSSSISSNNAKSSSSSSISEFICWRDGVRGKVSFSTYTFPRNMNYIVLNLTYVTKIYSEPECTFLPFWDDVSTVLLYSKGSPDQPAAITWESELLQIYLACGLLYSTRMTSLRLLGILTWLGFDRDQQGSCPREEQAIALDTCCHMVL